MGQGSEVAIGRRNHAEHRWHEEQGTRRWRRAGSRITARPRGAFWLARPALGIMRDHRERRHGPLAGSVLPDSIAAVIGSGVRSGRSRAEVITRIAVGGRAPMPHDSTGEARNGKGGIAREQASRQCRLSSCSRQCHDDHETDRAQEWKLTTIPAGRSARRPALDRRKGGSWLVGASSCRGLTRGTHTGPQLGPREPFSCISVRMSAAIPPDRALRRRENGR